MSKTRVLATAAGCLIALLAGNVLACGESLFRVGKGVAFREYTAPLPGSILVVANTEAELAMVERLAAAGHDIHVISDPAEIGDEIKQHHIDIVLAYFSQRAEVESQMSSVVAAATYIPVAKDGTLEISQAGELYAQSLSNEDSVKKFLKTIHRTLKTQS
jgi:hypothetical protein